MPRCLPLLAAVACAVMALGPAASQAPSQPIAARPAPLVLLLRGPSGQPVADAQGTLLSDPAWRLAALRGLLATNGPTSVATSAETGILRFDANPSPRAGTVLVTTADGLGAIVVRLLPGEAQRVVMQPMAEVTTVTGSEEFVLWAGITAADGERILLPPQQGTHVRLPAGSYEVWVNHADGWTWQRLHLVSGQRHELNGEGPAQRLQRAELATTHPAGWPNLELLGPDHAECVLLGAALAAPLSAWVPGTGRVCAEQVVPGPPSREARLWPPALPPLPGAQLRLAADADVLAGAAMFSLRRTTGGGWQLLGTSRAGTDGTFVLPRPEAGDDWLLVLTEQHAPLALPWSQVHEVQPLPLPRGLPLVVTATTSAGEPAIDLQLEYVPDGAEVATVMARSDGRGRATFPWLAAPGELRVSDPRFTNQTAALAAIPADGVHLVVDPGAALRGRALWPDGKAASGVLITLRDPRGFLRPATRAAVSTDDGSFAFVGLTEDLDLVLFATMRRDERTWSGRLAHARAGGEPIEVTLQNEDPQLGPTGPRK